MKTNKLALPLALIASLLAACGGGGSSNSPDRPGLRLQPDTLRIEFANNNNALAGTGNAKISARMLGLQTDGVDNNQTPELNLTAGTDWSISGTDNTDPVVAELAAEVRQAASLGDVQDILSTIRLMSDDTVKNLVLEGRYNFDGQNYDRSAPFTVRPPIPDGPAFISGPDVIAVDPLSTTPQTVNYQLLQRLKEIPTPENRTNTMKFCTDSNFSEFSEFLAFNGPQPPTSGSAPATVTNPFLDNDVASVSLRIAVIDPEFNCNQIGENIAPAGEDEVILAPEITKTVQLIPAVVADDGIAVCAVINADGDACSSSGEFNDAEFLTECRGLNTPSIEVPAGERVQMVARLTYTNPNNANQTPFVDYRCMAPERLSWAAAPDTIFADGLDETGGFGTLISRSEFQEMADSEPSSDVTGSFDNNNGADLVENTLTLKLVDSQVSAIDIERINPDPNDPNAPDADTLFINILNQPLEYRAVCTFGETNPIVAPCTNSCVRWTENTGNDILTIDPAVSASTTVSSTDDQPGSTAITASFICGANVSDSRDIIAVEDPLVALRLLQVSNGNQPDVRSVDPFSCVGRTDLVGTLADGETFIQGDQRFYAHALFESNVDNYNGDPSTLPDVTGADAVVFSALPGYANGDGTCTTGLPLDIPEIPGTGGGDEEGGLLSNLLGNVPVIGGVLNFYLGDVVDILTIPLDQLPGLPDGGAGAPGLSQTPAASFTGESKGSLQSNGLLRLSTVCVQAFVDNDGSGNFTENDSIAQDSSTVLVLPAADDELLNFSNEVCEILEPVLTLGANTPVGEFLPAGAVVPLVYGVSLIADPVLAAIATSDNGDGPLPAQEIINALITGEFSDLSIPGQPEFTDAPFGLGALTGGIFNGIQDLPGLGLLVDGLDSCVVDPLTTSVNALLTALLTFDPAAFDDLGGISPEDCQEVFGDLGGGLPGVPGLPGLPGGIPLPTP